MKAVTDHKTSVTSRHTYLEVRELDKLFPLAAAHPSKHLSYQPAANVNPTNHKHSFSTANAWFQPITAAHLILIKTNLQKLLPALLRAIQESFLRINSGLLFYTPLQTPWNDDTAAGKPEDQIIQQHSYVWVTTLHGLSSAL